ncbi:hypothetical protein [Mycobacterium canetti]|uniref:hypothetical protein n=1 Tax=Mycobacterium canetti TaxID=78331 RepID=UPI001E4611DC|nr:hypothetical protein [Mycobacterium canetti]
MADRRPPGFNVDLGFYSCAEVLSIPRKIRAAAVGVWTLCGSFAAHQLSDGYVSAEALKQLGCTPAIRAALMATKNATGKSSPLWLDAGAGAILITNWAKWQRTAAEIKGYREAESDRKRRAREAKKPAEKKGVDADVNNTSGVLHAVVDDTCATRKRHMHTDINDTHAPHNATTAPVTSCDTEMSARTSAGRPADVRAEHRDPKTETETETEVHTPVTLVEGGPGGDPPTAVAGRPAPADKRGTRIPDGWQPNPATVASMRQKFPDVDLDEVTEEFVDFWRAEPGARGRKLDWDATWRNRVREIASRQRARAPTRRNGATVATSDQRVAAVQALKHQRSRLELGQ